MDREQVLERLRPAVLRLVLDTEGQTGLRVAFHSLPATSHVIAEYQFTPPDRAKVLLTDRWEDVDVAHELLHMHMELVDGFSVLAWPTRTPMPPGPINAVQVIRSYVDDEVVFARLANQVGLRVDGEVLRPALFEDICVTVPKALARGAPREDDGMAHLDSVGYGDLRRSAFLVQVERALRVRGDELTPRHRKRARQFVRAFRAHRVLEARIADRVLDALRQHDVSTVEGHKEILLSWMRIAKLQSVVGTSHYEQSDGYSLSAPEMHC